MRSHSRHWCRSVFASWCLLGWLRRMMRLQDPLAWKILKNRLTTRCLAQFDIPAWLSLSLEVSDFVSLCKSRGPMRHDKLITGDDQIHVGCLGTPVIGFSLNGLTCVAGSGNSCRYLQESAGYWCNTMLDRWSPNCMSKGYLFLSNPVDINLWSC